MSAPTQVDKNLAQANQSLEKRRADLTDARKAEQLAEQALDTKRTDANLDAAAKATKLRESCERLVTSAEGGLELAQAEKREETRRELAAQLERDISELAKGPALVEPFINAIVQCDAQIDNAILNAAVIVSDLTAVYDRAMKAAHELNVSPRRIMHPDLAAFRIEVRRRLYDARLSETRDHELIPGYLVSLVPDWKTDRMSPSELAAYVDATERTAREEEAKRLRGEGFAMAEHQRAVMEQRAKEQAGTEHAPKPNEVTQ
jgi:hypothetical protein